jgi:hypothetical protein
MLLRRYFAAICRIGDDRRASTLIRVYFHMADGPPLLYAMRDSGISQCDLVLAMLHHGLGLDRTWEYVQMLCNARVLPPVRMGWPVINQLRTRVRRMRHVAPNPRRLNTPAHERYARAFRVGRTLEEARIRGATTKDIRQALRMGYVKMEEAA